MNVRVFKPTQRAFRAFLLSATALVAQPVWAADIHYTTAGPHTDAIVIDGSANRILAVNVVANFAGTVTFQNVVAGSSMLEIGGNSSGTIIFAPTAINILAKNQRNTFRISGGTTSIGNDIARSAIANDVALQLVNGGTLDLNGSNLTVATYQDGSASNTIINGAAATTATLVVNFKNESSHILSTITDGAGTLAVRFAGGNSATITGNNSYSGGTIVTADAQVIAGSSTALGTGIVRFEGAGRPA